MSPRSVDSNQSSRLFKPLGVAALVIAFGISFLLGTDGFQTYLSKERRLIEAGEVMAKALQNYRDASPGSAKDFPTELTDLLHDPRMLADKSYLTTLPVDPLTQKQEWGVLRNKINQVVGVHSLSTEPPTIYAKLFSFRGGEKYSDWTFTAE
jgi:hypothetical protein